MQDDTYWAAVTRLRLQLADLLETLAPEEWDHPSLCAGWRVRDVAGHLSLVPTVTVREMAAVAPRAGFDPDRINTALARKYGAADPGAIVARIRDHAHGRRTAWALSTANSLFDIEVHGHDIAVPLGREFPVPPDDTVLGLERVWAMGWPFRARKRYGHLALRATDADWAAGEGPEVRGPALALLLLLTGRGTTAAPSLEGPGLEVLALA
jgi:uncharacterized protein (TIGR03083 family)